MTLEEARSILDRVTYKQGTDITLEVNILHNTTWLYVRQPIIDANLSGYPQTTLGVGQAVKLNHVQTEHQFLMLIKECIQRWEFHESMEWLKIDGQLIYNPHSMI